jgi:hypothetical protein
MIHASGGSAPSGFNLVGAVLAATALVFMTAGCSAVTNLSGLSCINDPTEAAAERFQQETILEKFPPNMQPSAESSVFLGCDDDYGVTEVERPFSFTGSPFSVAAYYALEAPLGGWRMTIDGTKKPMRRVGTTELWPADTCYSKHIDGYEVDLSLAFDYWSRSAARNPGERNYWLQISFSASGGNCQNQFDLN